MALSALVPVALVALTIYLVLKILVTGTGWEDMRKTLETQQEILEIPRRIDPGADRLRSDLDGHAHGPGTGPIGFPGHGNATWQALS